MSAEKAMGDNKEQDQGFQEAVVMANKIERVEEDARQFENQVRKQVGLFIPQHCTIYQSHD